MVSPVSFSNKKTLNVTVQWNVPFSAEFLQSVALTVSVLMHSNHKPLPNIQRRNLYKSLCCDCVKNLFSLSGFPDSRVETCVFLYQLRFDTYVRNLVSHTSIYASFEQVQNSSSEPVAGFTLFLPWLLSFCKLAGGKLEIALPCRDRRRPIYTNATAQSTQNKTTKLATSPERHAVEHKVKA